jgi:hypothetical protein
MALNEIRRPPHLSTGWYAPRLGRRFRAEKDLWNKEWTFPVWSVLVVLLSWIAFREWRRKRAA